MNIFSRKNANNGDNKNGSNNSNVPKLLRPGKSGPGNKLPPASDAPRPNKSDAKPKKSPLVKGQKPGLSPSFAANLTVDTSKEDLQEKQKIRIPAALMNYELRQLLGKGSFAKVILVRHRGTKTAYAMKVMSKAELVKRRYLHHTFCERNLMAQLDHPFIVKMHAAFQSKKKVFMILDLCIGGDMHFHMSKKGKFSVEETRFYTCEIALALDFLHSRGVLFRDLKAENILMDRYGHAKLSDFGMAKEGITEWISGATTMCGTPAYMAPEIVVCDSYGLAIDWWALGVLAYEMIHAKCPFRGKDAQDLFDAICTKPALLLKSWDVKVKDLLKGLLCKDPQQRLGHDGGAEQILSAPLYDGTDWAAMVERRLTAPIIPYPDCDNMDDSEIIEGKRRTPTHRSVLETTGGVGASGSAAGVGGVASGGGKDQSDYIDGEVFEAIVDEEGNISQQMANSSGNGGNSSSGLVSQEAKQNENIHLNFKPRLPKSDWYNFESILVSNATPTPPPPSSTRPPQPPNKDAAIDTLLKHGRGGANADRAAGGGAVGSDSILEVGEFDDDGGEEEEELSRELAEAREQAILANPNICVVTPKSSKNHNPKTGAKYPILRTFSFYSPHQRPFRRTLTPLAQSSIEK